MGLGRGVRDLADCLFVLHGRMGNNGLEDVRCYGMINALCGYGWLHCIAGRCVMRKGLLDSGDAVVVFSGAVVILSCLIRFCRCLSNAEPLYICMRRALSSGRAPIQTAMRLRLSSQTRDHVLMMTVSCSTKCILPVSTLTSSSLGRRPCVISRTPQCKCLLSL